MYLENCGVLDIYIIQQVGQLLSLCQPSANLDAASVGVTWFVLTPVVEEAVELEVAEL